MKKILVGMLFLLLVAAPVKTSALSCIAPPPIEEAYENYDGVIIGVVDEIIRGKETNHLRLKVDTSFKGVKENLVMVEEDITWGNSNVGGEYLYYLTKEGDEWVHQLCTPTKLVSEADKEIDFLKGKDEIQLINIQSPDDPAEFEWELFGYISSGLGAILFGIKFLLRL